MVLVLDLNEPPPVVDMDTIGSPMNISPNFELAGENGPSNIQASIDFELIDDEVVICSPTSFAEARDRSRRNAAVIEVVDEETELQIGQPESTGMLSLSGNMGRRAPVERIFFNGGLCINLEDYEETKSENVAKPPELPGSVPPSEPPTFSCPVCKGPFVEETSTKCGHIFCKKCINAAIAAQERCPTCRRKLKVKDTIRIYLPPCD